MSKLVLKVCIGKWDSASRDKRELAACRELGLYTLVLAGGEPGDHGQSDIVDGFEVLRYATRPLGENASTKLNWVATYVLWLRAMRKIRPDIITAHDLKALKIAWLYVRSVPQRDRPALIYDAHEFEIGRNTNGKRGQLATWRVKQEEGFLMKRCAFSIVVNDSIADALQQVHHLEQRPVVVRSTPALWVRDEDAISRNRRAMLTEMPGVRYLLMSHGAIIRARGIPALIRAASRYSDIGLVLMGMQEDRTFIKELQQLAEKCGLGGRILFCPAVSQQHLAEYVGAADLEVMMIEPVVQSYYYALPNKFFESIQAEVPVIASDLPEMRRIIDQYHIGLCCKPNDVEELCQCIDKLREDTEFYACCKENLKIAKQDLCWEKEKLVLQKAYRALL
ncbi:glycosyltransferase [uncultured Subdoligranulum sp.]|nr:glycosyltransferase [uncultured Subdoligranulum sp.]